MSAKTDPIRRTRSGAGSRAHMIPKSPTTVRCEVCNTVVWTKRGGHVAPLSGNKVTSTYDAANNAWVMTGRCEEHA